MKQTCQAELLWYFGNELSLCFYEYTSATQIRSLYYTPNGDLLGA